MEHATQITRLLLLVTITALSGCLSSGDTPAIVAAGGTANRPPVLQGSPPNLVKVGESYSFQPNASDPDGDALSFEFGNVPSWADFDTTTGRFWGLPLLGNEGVYDDITITATDGNDSSSLVFSVTVTAVGGATVTLSWTPPTENEDGTALDNLAGYNIYYGDTTGMYPNSIHIDNPSISTYVVGDLTPKTYYFVATSVNSMGVESQYSNETTKVAN